MTSFRFGLLFFALIITGEGLAAQKQWKITPAPTVDITDSGMEMGTGHDMGLVTPIGAVRLPDGTIAVAEAHSGIVRLFDAAGRAKARVGHAGDGPGEFRHISWIGQCGGDSAFVWDKIHKRMSVIASSGRIAREFQLQSRELKSGAPFLLACSKQGLLVTQPVPKLPPPKPNQAHDRVTRGSARINIINLRTSKTVTTLPVPGGDIVIIGGGYAPMPLGRVTSFAVVGQRLLVGTGDSSTIRSFTLDGKAAPPIRLRLPARQTTQAHYERGIDDLLAQVPAQVQQRIRNALLSLKRPNPAPSYGALYPDPDSLIWVNLSLPGENTTRLRAYTLSGVPRGEVTVPIALTVFEIGRDYILGTFEDANAEPHVITFAFGRN